MKHGIKRAHVEKDTQQREKAVAVRYTDENAGQRPVLRVRGRVECIGLAFPYFVFLRASELFALEKGDFHSIQCLWRGVFQK